MADNEGEKNGAQASDEEGTGDAKGVDAGDDTQGKDGSGDEKLAGFSEKELREYLVTLRTENADRRRDNEKLKKDLDELRNSNKEASDKLKELEDAQKSDEQKEQERVAGLEDAANKVPSLEKYRQHVEAKLKLRMEEVKKLDKEVQKSLKDLLSAIPEDDFLARLNAAETILSVSEKKEVVPEGDEANPGDVGSGESGRTMAKDLAWSPMGQEEAAMAGLIKSSSD